MPQSPTLTLGARLEEGGILARLDETLLTELCCCWARLRVAERALTMQGMVVEAAGRKDRGFVKNPFITVATQLRASLQRYLAESGLTPAARERLSVKPPEGDNDSPFDV